MDYSNNINRDDDLPESSMRYRDHHQPTTLGSDNDDMHTTYENYDLVDKSNKDNNNQITYNSNEYELNEYGNNLDFEKNPLQNDDKKNATYFTTSDDLDDSIIIDENDSANVFIEETKLNWISRILAKLPGETNGIEPIPDEEKNDDSLINAASMWFSANMVLPSFSVGVLGTAVYGLNFGQAALTCIFFNLFGLIFVAFFSVFGAELSMRQMVLSRFLIGNATARIFAVINTIACAGWGIVNTVAAAQLLNLVNSPSGHNAPLWAGCLIIIGGTVAVSFFGYKVIHIYEKYSWIPNFAVFLVIIARLHKSGQYNEGPWTGGPTTAGSVLSFGCATFGFASGWTTYAADYTVYMPRSTNKYKIFFSLVFGLAFPLFFSQLIGAACGTGVVVNQEWSDLYKSNGGGGIVYAVLSKNSLHAFGDFCCVLFAISTIANNVPNMYTISLSVPAIWSKFNEFPRILWTLIANGVVLGIAIPCCYYFSTFMGYFMDSIGYYLAIYVAMSCSEHFIYRKGKFSSYHSEDWNNRAKLPIGIAGVSGLIVGAFGVALGMVQTYWEGEIGRLIGKYGGDIGFEMGMSWSFIIYNIVRPLELKYFGR